MTMAPWTRTVPIKSLTLPAAIPFVGHELNAGIAEAMITTSMFYETLPFQRVDGDVGETYYDDCKNVVSEISSAAKNLGRSYMRDVTKTLSSHNPLSVGGQRIGFDLLGFLRNQVNSADFFMAHKSLIRSIYSLYRASDSAWDDRQEFPSGRVVPVHEGVPIFRNDFMDEGHLILGRFDDGTRTVGVTGLIPDTGFVSATRIKSGWHLVFTGGLAIFSKDAVASLVDVKPY